MLYRDIGKSDTMAMAIEIENVSKVFRSYKHPSDRLLQLLTPGGRSFANDFQALKSVSFSVQRGETVGIIGRNGSGKSTLLQIICGTLRPSSGGIKVNGRVAALLELGAGFNPEFTGRENVYLNATILGMSRAEIDERFDNIARFADLGPFIDRPVKTYSSGMYIRLAFATAINADPEILIIDEALAVGDEAFQRKCFARIEQIQEQGGTILFVSHSAGSVLQLCNRAILLDGGEKLVDGRPKFVVNQYQRLVNLPNDEALHVRQEIMEMADSGEDFSSSIPSDDSDESGETERDEESLAELEFYDPGFVSKSCVSYETRGACIRDLKLMNMQGQQVNTLQIGQDYYYQYLVDFEDDFEAIGCGMMIKTINGIEISGGTSILDEKLLVPAVSKGQTLRACFKFKCQLLPATYFLNAGVLSVANGEEVFLHRLLEGLVFKVAYQPKLIGTGILDLQVEAPKIERVSDPAS